jgi:hypothetical protein
MRPARMHYIYAEGQAAKAKVAAARELVARNGTAREQSHVDVLALGMESDPAKSLERALDHLDSWPRDAVIMLLLLGAFGLFAFSGMADHDQARVDLCERHARHYGDDWWFLTYLGWSHTENGNVAIGRRTTERAFEKRRENANAVHALAHAMFEDGSTANAEALIASWLPTYDRTGLLYGHIFWHQALLALEQGDAARALAIYADRMQPKVSAAPPITVVTDGASLLWRCFLCGHPVPKAVLGRCRGQRRARVSDRRHCLRRCALRPRRSRDRQLGRTRQADRRPRNADKGRQARRGAGRADPLPGSTRLCWRRLCRLRATPGAGSRRGGPHRRQPCPARSDRRHAVSRADEERPDGNGTNAA